MGSAPKEAAGGKQVGDDMTLSREIVVLDLKEEPGEPNSSSSSAAAAAAASASASASAANDSAGDSDQTGQARATGASGRRLPHRSSLKAATEHSGDFSTTTTIDNYAANKHCLSSQSLFVLICSVGLFFVLYVCVVAYFFARRNPKISPIKHQFH